MIDTKKLFKIISEQINFFSGVPDSNLRNLNNLLTNSKTRHFICVNEGSAVAMAIGYYLSSNKIPAVYFQNSGLSNGLNPLLSIAHKKVYGIPMLLIIGWRGSPNSGDEPQHTVMGKITRNFLKLADIKFLIIKNNEDLKNIKKLLHFARLNNSTVAILIKNDSLKLIQKKNNEILKKEINKNSIYREDVIRELCKQITKKTYIVSNTGFASRELDKILTETKNKYIKPFYMIGGMGHTSMVALSYSLNKKKNDIICLDGDGSLIMHFGSMITVGKFSKKNFKHLLINNFQHESVGGQPTNVDGISFSKFAKLSGYKKTISCNSKKTLETKINDLIRKKQSLFLQVNVVPKKIIDLPRPKNFYKIKNNFMK